MIQSDFRLGVPAVEAGFAPVIRLLFRGRPSTVARLIVAIVVDSVDRVPRGRAAPHVMNERRETLCPGRTHDYAATAIFVIVTGARRVASALHQCPHVVFRCCAQSMRSVYEPGSFSVKASTREDLSAEVILPHGGNTAAVTSTAPCAVPRRRSFCFAENGESAEPLARQGRFASMFHGAHCNRESRLVGHRGTKYKAREFLFQGVA